MDIDTKERIYYIDKRIEELSMHAVMYARAGGNSNTVMEEFARIEELRLEKEDLINSTNKLSTYKKIRKLESEIKELKELKKAAILFKKIKYNTKIKELEEKLKEEKNKMHSR